MSESTLKQDIVLLVVFMCWFSVSMLGPLATAAAHFIFKNMLPEATMVIAAMFIVLPMLVLIHIGVTTFDSKAMKIIGGLALIALDSVVLLAIGLNI